MINEAASLQVGQWVVGGGTTLKMKKIFRKHFFNF